MKRILTLTTKDFYTGVAIGSNVDRGGIWYEAKGINVFRDTSAKSRYAGLLQTCESSTDKIGSITGTPIAYANDSANDQAWFACSGLSTLNDGDIATMNTNTMGTLSSEFATIRGLGTGMEIFQASGGGTRYLYYFDVDALSITQARLRKIDIDAGTPAQSDVLTTLNFDQNVAGSYLNRPTVLHKDGFYFGHMNNLGYVRDDRAGGTLDEAAALDFPENVNIGALESDGNYVVIAGNTQFNYLKRGDARIYFWDTNLNTWNKEWAIPEAYIISLTTVGDAIYAQTSGGLWVFNYQTRPVKLRDYDSGQLPIFSTTTMCNSSGAFNNAVVFGSEAIKSYGEIMPGMGVSGVFHEPLFNTGGLLTSLIAPDVREGYVLVGTYASGDGGLEVFNTFNGGGTTFYAKSVTIPLDHRTNIKEFEFSFGEPIGASDVLVVSAYNETLDDEGLWATSTGYVTDDLVFNNGVAYQCISNHTSGATDEPGVGVNTDTYWKSLEFGRIDGSNANHVDRRRVTVRGSLLNCDQYQFVLGFAGGNPKIKKLDINASKQQ
jgi:hypothetical protein